MVNLGRLAERMGIQAVSTRLQQLNKKYVSKCIATKDPLIMKLAKEYVSDFGGKAEQKKSPLWSERNAIIFAGHNAIIFAGQDPSFLDSTSDESSS